MGQIGPLDDRQTVAVTRDTLNLRQLFSQSNAADQESEGKSEARRELITSCRNWQLSHGLRGVDVRERDVVFLHHDAPDRQRSTNRGDFEQYPGTGGIPVRSRVLSARPSDGGSVDSGTVQLRRSM